MPLAFPHLGSSSSVRECYYSRIRGAIYSRIALSFALNHIFFSAYENGTVKQNNQSDFKAFLTHQSHCRKIKDKKAIVWQLGSINIGPDQNLVRVFRILNCVISNWI